jgi:hypothetical protein
VAVEEEEERTSEGYDAIHAEAAWNWGRVLPVAWLITWRGVVIFVAIIASLLAASQLMSAEVSFETSTVTALSIIAVIFFVLWVVPFAISAQMATRKKYQNFQILVVGNQGARLAKLTFGQAARMGWLFLWRVTMISLLVTMVLAVPLMAMGLYEIDETGSNLTVTTPWFIFLPIYLFTIRAGLRKRYRGFHLTPDTLAANNEETRT